MIKKEWREVGRQSLYFILVLVAMALLLGGVDLLMGAMGFAQAKPLEDEKLILILGTWLLMFSMFMGLSPFALDSKQKGMEYLLTLPYSRRWLLVIKLLPRLAAVVLFYLAYVLLYFIAGNSAFGGGSAFFSLAYFALFFISFSLAVIHENFIIQSIWAGIALCGYLALCLFVVLLGFSWKFKMPASWVGSSFWHDLSYDIPTLLVSIAVFLLMAAPFVVSFFLAFKKFDLKPSRVFNRRHLLIFVPLLLLAFAASLGVTYLVQSSSPGWESDFFILGNHRLLKAGIFGKLTVYDEAGSRKIDTKGRFYWDRLLLEEGDRLYLSGYDVKDGSQFIGSLNLVDLSWKVLHRCPHQYSNTPGYMGFRYDGESFVYMRRRMAEAERPGMMRRRPAEDEQPGMNDSQVIKNAVLEIVCVDPASGRSRTIVFRDPMFRRHSEPWFIGGDERDGLRFWLVAQQWHNVLRLWEDGRIEDLGLSRGLPAYAGGLLFTRGDNSLQVRRLLAAGAGSEIIQEIEGGFVFVQDFFHSLEVNNRIGELYAQRNQRIVRIDLSRPEGVAVSNVGPFHGHIRIVPPGDFYYIEFETWPGQGTDKWKKLYRLQGGKMIFLRQFDFHDAGYGHVEVNAHGVILWQHKIAGQDSEISYRFFAFPDLRELKFKNLN